MDGIFADLKLSCVLIYLTNINVFSRTFNDHLDHLQEVFLCLINKNLKLKPRNYSFFRTQLKFLGHIILTEGNRPIPAEIEPIAELQPPTNILDVQFVLSMEGCY